MPVTIIIGGQLSIAPFQWGRFYVTRHHLVGHGGISIQEVIVPLVKIDGKSFKASACHQPGTDSAKGCDIFIKTLTYHVNFLLTMSLRWIYTLRQKSCKKSAQQRERQLKSLDKVGVKSLCKDCQS